VRTKREETPLFLRQPGFVLVDVFLVSFFDWLSRCVLRRRVSFPSLATDEGI